MSQTSITIQVAGSQRPLHLRYRKSISPLDLGVKVMLIIEMGSIRITPVTKNV